MDKIKLVATAIVAVSVICIVGLAVGFGYAFVEKRQQEQAANLPLSEFILTQTPRAVFELEGETVCISRTAFLASGPSIYLYDSNGDLKSWQYSSGEGGKLDKIVEKFQDEGVKRKRVGSKNCAP